MRSVYFLPILILPLFLLISCNSPSDNSQSEQGPQWWKGNLHTHSFWSDGYDFPEMILDSYIQEGYHFVAMTEHDLFPDHEKWLTVEKGSDREDALRDYLLRFGSDWVEVTDTDTAYRVRLKTFNEMQELFDKDGQFLMIQSEEITDRHDNKPVHLNVHNPTEVILPQGGESIKDALQQNLNRVIEQQQESDRTIITHINHPNFGWAKTADDLKPLEGTRLFEVYNGHPLVNNYGDDERPGTEEIWDEVITHNLLEGKPPMLGIAVDDAHHYREIGPEYANPFRGWVHVRSESLHTDSLLSALEKGDFYSSTGVTLHDVSFTDGTLSLDIDEQRNVTYTIQFIGTRLGDEQNPGIVLDEQRGGSASYTLQPDDLYVRAKIISDRLQENPFAEGDVETAWTQPVFLKE